MKSEFSLDDRQILEMYRVAQTSNDADTLRGMFYKMIKLRKEMAVAIYELTSSRSDLAAINESAAAALSMDKKQGLLALIDRKGLIKQLQDQVAKQLEVLNRLAREKETLRRELQSARSVGDDKAVIQALRQEIATAEGTMAQLRQQNTLANAKANQLELNNHGLHERIRHLDALIADLRQQLDTAEQLQKPEAAAEQPAMPQAPVASAQEHSSFVRDLFNQQIAALADRNVQLEREVGLLNEQNEAISGQLRLAQEQVDQLKQEMVDLKTTHQSDIQQSNSKLQAALAQLDSMEAQIKDQLEKLGTLTDQNANLQLQLQTSNQAIAELQEQIRRKDAEISLLNSSLGSERSRNEELQSILKTTSHNLTEAQAKIERQNSENQQTTLELSELSRRLEEAVRQSTESEMQLKGEIESLTQRLRDSLEQLDYLKGDKASLEKNIQRLNDRSARLIDLNRNYQASLREISNDRSNLRQLAASVSLDNTGLRRENAELQEICEAQSTELKRLGSQLTLASKVIHLRGPGDRKGAVLAEHDLESNADHASETVSPGN